MAAYKEALRVAAGRRFIDKYRFGFMDRFLTESHVRGQLQHLIAAYAVVEQSLGPDREEAEWFKNAREQLDRTSAALRNLGGSVASVTPLPAIAGFVGITSGLGVWQRWETPVVILLLGTATLVGFHTWHRRGKRLIFGGASSEGGTRVEQLEKGLFEYLPLRRRRDLPNTLVGLFAAACLIGAGIIVWTAADDCVEGVVAGVGLLAVGAALALYYGLVRPVLRSLRGEAT
jgi:hypothetical protein